MLVGDVEQMDPLPLPERHFDCVIFGDTLEHLKEPEALLRRLRRHVKRDGLLIANVPNIAHWSVIV
ncbi:MAG: methyltransferase domain-containing protein, partial [Fimbriimonas ginsengisoli]|nr:methyltransferase domain-containing protein [Fimbriimonas ginsengisoli]